MYYTTLLLLLLAFIFPIEAFSSESIPTQTWHFAQGDESLFMTHPAGVHIGGFVTDPYGADSVYEVTQTVDRGLHRMKLKFPALNNIWTDHLVKNLSFDIEVLGLLPEQSRVLVRTSIVGQRECNNGTVGGIEAFYNDTDGWYSVQNTDLISINKRAAIDRAKHNNSCGGITEDEYGTTTSWIYFDIKNDSQELLNVTLRIRNLNVEFADQAPSPDMLQDYKDRIAVHMQDYCTLLENVQLSGDSAVNIGEFQSRASAVWSSHCSNSVGAIDWIGKVPTWDQYEAVTNVARDFKYARLQSEVVDEDTELLFYKWDVANESQTNELSYPVPATPEDSISIDVTAAKGEVESATFIIKAMKSISNVQFTLGDLTNDHHEYVIPAENAELFIVKSWYQANVNKLASGGNINSNGGVSDKRHLVPELLIKNDQLVTYTMAEEESKKKNWLLIETATSPVTTSDSADCMPVMQGNYLDVSSPESCMPQYAYVTDAEELQPFVVNEFSNKQIWLKINVPEDSDPGLYQADLHMNFVVNGETRSKLIPLKLTVLPFSLDKSGLDYQIYYRGQLREWPSITSDRKSEIQYKAELKNILDHGFDNIISYYDMYGDRYYEEQKIEEPYFHVIGEEPYFRIKYNDLGMSCENIYYFLTTHMLNGTYYDDQGNEKAIEDVRFTDVEKACQESYSENICGDMERLKLLKARLEMLQNYQADAGCTEGTIYISATDEQYINNLKRQMAAFNLVKDNFGGLWAAIQKGAYGFMGDKELFDTVNFGSELQSEVNNWKGVGTKVMRYGIPTAGLESFDLYRRYYGFNLVKSGYDGVFFYTYQDQHPRILSLADATKAYPPVWNDFDSTHARDVVMTYPTSNGVVDTLQWEGMREAIDDSRYFSTLMRISPSSALELLDTYDYKKNDPAQFRGKVVQQIIKHLCMKNDYDINSDLDEDGLSDVKEVEIGTDPLSGD
ncbi:MAG: hypothetical protein D6B27_07485 [Gammaproteobacteria bacterium]|nr:MAG: hypothetical protein D6B27_07485 [Gammaproteobacteria bacterium]